MKKILSLILILVFVLSVPSFAENAVVPFDTLIEEHVCNMPSGLETSTGMSVLDIGDKVLIYLVHIYNTSGYVTNVDKIVYTDEGVCDIYLDIEQPEDHVLQVVTPQSLVIEVDKEYLNQDYAFNLKEIISSSEVIDIATERVDFEFVRNDISNYIVDMPYYSY